MQVYKNSKFTLIINGSNVTVKNSFGDTYTGTLDKNGRAVTKSKLGLSYIVRALNELVR